MDMQKLSREDVIGAFEAILGRHPESEATIASYQSFPSRIKLGEHLLKSQEFSLRQYGMALLPLDQLYTGYTPSELAIFSQFKAYSGQGTPGFITNFLGVKVRVAFSTPLEPYSGAVEGYPVPVGGLQAETAEYIGLLRSVLESGPSYRLLECGAGYGTWVGMADAALKQRSILDYHLYGVEGDAGHCQFAQLHQADNNIPLDQVTFINGAVGPENGIVSWAVVDDSAAVYGGRPMADSSVDYHGQVQSNLVQVQSYAINDLLLREPVWDLMHVDIQGGEAALCRAGIELMNQRLKRIIIGTHSRALDGEVMSIFHKAGWALENEKPTVSFWQDGAPTLEMLARVDGIQVWRNPRLAGTPSF